MHTEVSEVSRILPPKEDEGEPLSTSLRIPKAILGRIDAVAKASNYTRTEVILHFLRWALEEYDAEQETDRKAKR